MKVFLWSQRYKYPKSIAKLNLFYQVSHTEALLLKKRGHKTGVFPVLQNLTHMWDACGMFISHDVRSMWDL